MPGRLKLLPVHYRSAVFGRGSISSMPASGWMAKDRLYLDLVGVQGLIFNRRTLTMSKDRLSHSLNAYDAQGPGQVLSLAGKYG